MVRILIIALLIPTVCFSQNGRNRMMGFGSKGPAARVCTPPLDTVTGINYAFSVARRLKSGMDYAIQVRRSSDNATMDIGFLNDCDLDTVTLKAFVGAGDGFVKILYDQSTGTATAGHNLSQTTNALQPTIMVGGVINRGPNSPYGIPIIDFNGTYLTADHTPNWTTTNFVQFVGNSSITGNASTGFINYTANSGNDPEFRMGVYNELYYYLNGGYVINGGFGIEAYNYHSLSSVDVAGTVNVEVYMSGVVAATGSRAGSYSTSTRTFAVGYYGAIPGTRNGNLHELVIYSADKRGSRAYLENETNNYY